MEILTEKSAKKAPVMQATSTQHLYRHQNRRYYVRTFAGGKEKWASLGTKIISVARNRMKPHLDAAEREQLSGHAAPENGKLLFSDALKTYRENLAATPMRPSTKAFRAAGLKLLAKSWPEIDAMSVRRIKSKMVEVWLTRFVAAAKPHTPPGAKAPSRNSTGASATTIKCALDAVRHVLDVAVESGHLSANPARNQSVTAVAKKLLQFARRERSSRGGPRIPSREEFQRLVKTIDGAGFNECKAAAEFVQFIAFTGARKNEALHVLWSDIDFKNRQVHLRVTKNGDARHVPLIPEMLELLERMKMTRASMPGDARVLRVKEAQGFIDFACKKLGIPRFTTHGLRHLFGTTCLEANIPVRMVASWLGHKDNGALLLKVYSHVRSDHESEMALKVRFGPVPAHS